MSADYKTNPLRVCARATGGADVDVSATLFVDDEAIQDGDVTLVDVHKKRKCAAIVAGSDSGDAVLRLIFIVVPLAGNGEFEVTVEISHPAIDGSPRVIKRTGNAPNEPKAFVLKFKLP